MDFTDLRKGFLKLFLGFLGITALVAIASVVSGELGSIQVKILITCFTISAASISAMACAAFIERRQHVRPGILGISLAVLSATLVITGVWVESGNEWYWKVTVTIITLAIGAAHGLILNLPDLNKKSQWVQTASTAIIVLLVLLIHVVIWGEVETEWFYRLLTIVAILTGLVTLAIPILMKLHADTGVDEELLLLKRLEFGKYQAPDGDIYHVEKIEPSVEGASGTEPGNENPLPSQ